MQLATAYLADPPVPVAPLVPEAISTVVAA
jgi:hypothetical protein